MVILQVKEVAQAKGVKTANALALRSGIPLASMYRIWNGKAQMIGLDTLEKICAVLDVHPGLLFHRRPPQDTIHRT